MKCDHMKIKINHFVATNLTRLIYIILISHIMHGGGGRPHTHALTASSGHTFAGDRQQGRARKAPGPERSGNRLLQKR